MKLLFINTQLNYINIHLVCNTGYYKDGSGCVLCTGNTIKLMAGDVTSCTTSCDGTMKVANAEHTFCGICFRQSNHNRWLTKLIIIDNG